MKIFKNLTFQVLVAIVFGIILGAFFPKIAVSMKPLGDIFINMIKMVIAPIVFFTIVLGIGGMSDMKKVGRVGGKALLYFEIVTTIALVLGLLFAEYSNCGRGVNVSTFINNKNNTDKIQNFTKTSSEINWIDFVIHIVPHNIFEAFAKGDMLQILFFAVLFGFALSSLKEKSTSVLHTFEKLQNILFKMLTMVMKIAPIGAFSGMAYTIGSVGITMLIPLGKLMLTVYFTMAIFIFGFLGLIAFYWRFSIFKFIRFIKDEILIVLGTSSSESVLPKMIDKMQELGCSKAVSGLVIPTGYSFNLDGTSIYLSIAMVFLAQAFGIDLSLYDKITIIGILMLTSKGAAAITGGGFIVLASTISAIGIIPIEGLALLLGVDRFMSEARAITNLIGNGVATVVIAKSEGEFEDQNLI